MIEVGDDPRIAALHHRVGMTDVDLVQINFTRYFVWMDAGYTALLRGLGHPLSEILAADRATPLVHASCEYLRPIGLDHAFRSRTAVIGLGRSSYTVAHRFEDDDGLFALARGKHVWVRTKPAQDSQPIPDWLRDAVVQDFVDDHERATP